MTSANSIAGNFIANPNCDANIDTGKEASHDSSRRVFLKTALVAGCSVYTLASEAKVYGEWSQEVFDAEDLQSVLGDLAEDTSAAQSDRVILTVPASVENPVIVPVSVTVDMEQVESVAILIESNKTPLASKFNFSDGVDPQISTRVKLDASGAIHALVKAGGKYYINSAEVAIQAFECKPVKQQQKKAN